MTLPNWQVTAPDGSDAPPLTEYKGKNLLILFYSMGCPGCWSRAIPVTLQLREIYPDLQIAAIHTHFERSRHTPEEILAATREKGVDYPVWIDRGTETAELFQAEGTPHWILVDERGELLKSIFGSMPNALQRLDLSLRELYQESA